MTLTPVDLLPPREPYATLKEMQTWADALMDSRPPDFVIGDGYLERWFVVPRNPAGQTYLHRINRSDDDRALHDHPWDNTSYVLRGAYLEWHPWGSLLRREGEIIPRIAICQHRLQLIDNQPVVTLFTTGPKIRDWGFWPDDKFVPWREWEEHTDA